MPKARIIPILFLLASTACSDTADTTPDPEPAGRRAASAGAQSGGTASGVDRCGVDDGTVLSGDGVGQLRVGAALARVRANCTVLTDTTAPGAEGMRERRINVDLERDTVEAIVVNDSVWRIHVDGSAFRTAEGLGVGNTVAELRQDRAARVLAGEGSMFIALADHCGLSFRLGGVPFGPERPVEELPAEGRVVEVLAFGCDSPQP
jgi:hypothetical protein